MHDGYSAAAGGTPYEQLTCDQKQGAWASHGIHYFVTHDTDNAATPGHADRDRRAAVAVHGADGGADQRRRPVRERRASCRCRRSRCRSAAPAGSCRRSRASQTRRPPTRTSPVTITLAGLDLDTCELAFTIVTPPAHGTLGAIASAACAAGVPNTDTATVLYTPTAGVQRQRLVHVQGERRHDDALLAGHGRDHRERGRPLPTATPTAGRADRDADAARPARRHDRTPTVAPTGPTPRSDAGPARSAATRRDRLPAPDPTSKGALLTIKKDANTASKDRLLWKWGKGAATAKGDFGIPTPTTDYELCIYDGNEPDPERHAPRRAIPAAPTSCAIAGRRTPRVSAMSTAISRPMACSRCS